MSSVGFFLDFAEKAMEKFSVDLLAQGGWRRLNDMDATAFKDRLFNLKIIKPQIRSFFVKTV